MEKQNFITPKELSKLIGINICTLSNWRRAHTNIPYFKIGGKIGYKSEDVEKFVKNRRVETKYKILNKKHYKKTAPYTDKYIDSFIKEIEEY